MDGGLVNGTACRPLAAALPFTPLASCNAGRSGVVSRAVSVASVTGSGDVVAFSGGLDSTLPPSRNGGYSWLAQIICETRAVLVNLPGDWKTNHYSLVEKCSDNSAAGTL
jgi:hypothetical protein